MSTHVDPEFAGRRVEYTGDGLSESQLRPTPAEQFRAWYADAAEAGGESNAMVLATAGEEGPSARIVLLKGFDAEGFCFYTNYGSAKAADIATDDRVALVFPWHHLQRQVRVSGRAVKAPAERSDAYFASRDRFSRLTAWASQQSRPAEGRAQLDAQLAQVESRFGAGDVPRPEFWGGYIVQPREIEFWAGRLGRFHDRLVFRRRGEAPASLEDAAGWEVLRRQP
ncbi:pyridoxamine 5'-phosphate oxidase [Sediminivirga luteola]|uniref:pyridoxamine 5'-phosphate oxidase n=1 Tax=Sediminivirga luteola TaxID=1774748 RepID=UPI00166A0FCE|nr:pyridoxamine 5'-phosphate oxidase [Sediminivirga luteola]MCI2265942.1 pyridoxamine 5'-phosphate oxidase [Sediminivirga luteola]